MGYYSALKIKKKKGNLTISDNMDNPGGHFVSE